ncbi:MAG: iron-containing alcohol dehydrogenase [Clostridia bacterium]|jgi:alcohol dehydrogenase|nr:iron-containing alcohol dehydrogenase [Clostridia bacterium]
MQNFRFLNKTEIIFGKDTQKEVGAEVKKHGSKVLLHYGSGHIKKSGLYDEVIESLNESNVDFIELGGVKPNPRLALVREGIALCREHKVDFILSVGGGSVIDSAKAIAVGARYDGDVWDFFYDKAVIKQAIPNGVVLTIPAAGSESSDGSVITDLPNKNKRHIGSPLIIPTFAIMNPELTYTLPAYQTACGTSDIMAHVMERYFTNVKDVDFTDRLCESTLKTMIHNAPLALANPSDYASRSEIMWAGTLAHNNLLDTGREGDWSTHMIEHEISGINDVAHGAGLSIVFPAYLKYVYKHDIARFVQFAVRVWNVDQSFGNPEQTALEGIARLESFLKSLGLPTMLSQIDLDESSFERIATNCRKTNDDGVGYFVKLYEQDIKNILKLAL